MKLFNFLKKEDRKPMSRKTKKKIKIIVAIVLVLAIGLGAGIHFMGKKNSQAGGEINTATVRYGNIRSAISASGTIEPINMYEVTALVKGDVISANFEEGDVVEQDDILYQIDTTEMQNTLEKAKLSMDRTKDSYNDTMESVENLNIKAPFEGTITEMYVKKGDNVSNGTKICDMIDKSQMVLTIPFNENDARSLYSGQSAEVILENSFYSTTGKITRVSTGSLINENNVSVSYVDILVDNPGAINKGDTATAVVGNIACNAAGTFEYYQTKTVTAQVSGEIVSLNEGKGNKVSSNDVIAVIESETVQDNLKNSKRTLREAEISLQNTYDQLDNYTIKAPIKGTIIEKNVKAGDKIDNGTSSKILCVIADMSTIIFTINVDELDIDKIQLGQRVDITADALPNTRFDGYVNNININGSTSNGVTTYPVEIVVNEPEGLLPGMNVNAEIVIAEKNNVLVVPVTSVMRGNVVYVKDTKDSSKASADKKDEKATAKPEGENNQKEEVNNSVSFKKSTESSDGSKKPNESSNGSKKPTEGATGERKAPEGFEGKMPEGFSGGNRPTPPEGFEGKMPEGFAGRNRQSGEESAKGEAAKTPTEGAKTEKASESTEKPKSESAPKANGSEKPETTPKATEGAKSEAGSQKQSGNRSNQKGMSFSNVPEGFRAVQIVTGLSDDNYIEIVEGLEEGDIVYVRAQITTTTNGQMMQNRAGGMGGMGGMMPGGMGGGMPRSTGGMSGGMQRSSGGMSGGAQRSLGGNR